MIRILFVDDEPNVLNGLRRMLHSMTGYWEMVFVSNPHEALRAVDAVFFDIIVADLHMPDMDGSVLLQEVRRRSPETVRIALSGYSDPEVTLRAVSQMHQFLVKPCSPDELVLTLGRAASLGSLLTNKRLKCIVAQIKTLPSVTRFYDDIVRALEQPEPSVTHVGELIARDASMSSKVLHLVNSALFSLPHVVSDPIHATALLGLDTLHALVFSVKIFDQFTAAAIGGLQVTELWNHCVAVARLAKRLAVLEGAGEEGAEAAFLGGLMHDIGKIVLALDNPTGYASVVEDGKGHCGEGMAREERIFKGNHAEVGAYLMGLWGFSEPIVEAIYLHHAPKNNGLDEFGPLAAVHCANALICMRESSETSFFPYADESYLKSLGLLEHIPLWIHVAEQTIEKEAAA